MKIFDDIINILQEKKKFVSTMESCTGGGLACEITNHLDAGEVLKFSAVTYSNEFKIKMGVFPEVIDKFSVYSAETAKEMAKNISKFTGSDYGIGITGKLNDKDPANPGKGADNQVFISIYDSLSDTYYDFKKESDASKTRKENKEVIIEYIGARFFEILNK